MNCDFYGKKSFINFTVELSPPTPKGRNQMLLSLIEYKGENYENGARNLLFMAEHIQFLLTFQDESKRNSLSIALSIWQDEKSILCPYFYYHLLYFRTSFSLREEKLYWMRSNCLWGGEWAVYSLKGSGWWQ